VIAAAALVLACLTAGPAAMPLAEPPPIEVWASEDWPADWLAAAARLPGASLGLVLRSNMVRPEALGIVKRRRAGLIRLVPPLAPVHVEQFRKVTRVTLVVPVPGPLDPGLAAQLVKLGPQPLRVLVPRMDAATATSLAPLRHAEVELDVRGRVPDQEELGVFLGLSRVRRVVRLGADAPPALVAALRVVRPVRFVVESVGGRLPEPLLAALVEARVPVRVGLDARATSEDLKRLAPLAQLSLELTLASDPEKALPAARALLEGATASPPSSP
jgi:hypothetical protein